MTGRHQRNLGKRYGDGGLGLSTRLPGSRTRLTLPEAPFPQLPGRTASQPRAVAATRACVRLKHTFSLTQPLCVLCIAGTVNTLVFLAMTCDPSSLCLAFPFSPLPYTCLHSRADPGGRLRADEKSPGFAVRTHTGGDTVKQSLGF